MRSGECRIVFLGYAELRIAETTSAAYFVCSACFEVFAGIKSVVRWEMPEHGIRSPLTQCPVRLEMLDKHGVIASASAFFYESQDNRTFLVTNWHNVSGRNFVTGAPNQQDTGAPRFPTQVSAKIMSDTGRIDADGSPLLDVRDTDLPLYDEEYSPVWLEHPTAGRLCDVVALPMERPTSASPVFHRPANRVSPLRIPVRPGNTVFIIGYPHGITVSKGLPVWKSGYIASEPHFPVTLREPKPLTVPAFFIDSQTRKGMSGSPVFAEYVGNWNTSDPYSWDGKDPLYLTRPDVMIGSHGVEFVGCYGGRIPDNRAKREGASHGAEEDAALGLCWTKDAIEKICRAGRRAANPHVTPAV